MRIAQAGVKIGGSTIIADDVPLIVAQFIVWLIVSIWPQMVIIAISIFVEVCGEIYGRWCWPVEKKLRKQLWFVI